MVQRRLQEEQAAGLETLTHTDPAAAITAAVEVSRRDAPPRRGAARVDGAGRDRRAYARRGSRSASAVAEGFAAAVLAHRDTIVHPDPELAVDVAYRMAFSTLGRRVVFGPTFESKRRVASDRFVAEQPALCRAYLLGE